LINSFSGPRNIDYADFGLLNAPSTPFRPSRVNVHELLPTGPTLLDQVSNVVFAGAGGLKTGGKAVVNSAAATAVSFATLGFKDYAGPFNVTQADRNNSYTAASIFGRVGFEILAGVATGGLAQISRVGTTTRAVANTALVYDTVGNTLTAGRGLNDARQNGLGVGNSVQIIGSGLGLGSNVTAGNRALQELASDASRLRLDPNALMQLNSGPPLNALKVVPKVNLNTNSAVGHFGVYKLLVNNELYKVGKAHLDRITQSSGLATRIHQQLRKLVAIYGRENVRLGKVEDLGKTTTAQAKLAEATKLQEVYKATGKVPLGNQNSFRP
jgi:hypothetical protein